MKMLKLLGLAAIAALASMAFMASSASADVLCTQNVGNAECEAADIWGNDAGEFVLGLSSAAVLEAESIFGPVKVTCVSAALGINLKSEGPHKGLEALLHALSFTDCKGDCANVTGNSAENLPYAFLALRLNGAGETKPHAIAKKHPDGAGNPAALLNNCIIGLNCLYEAAEPLLDVNGHFLEANNVALTRSTAKGHSSLCPATGTWNADYLIEKDLDSTPAPLFLAALP